jgi:hypothetical protein
LSSKISISDAFTLQKRFCTVIWNVIDDRCQSRIWYSLVMSSRDQEAIWKISFTALFTSNSRAARASYLVTKDIESDGFKSSFPSVNYSLGDKEIKSNVIAPGPYPKLNRESLYSCLTHYDCESGLFCSSKSLQQAAAGFQGGGGPGPNAFGCDLCRYCTSDTLDPIDGFCPRDLCGPNTGLYPSCVNTQKLLESFTCPSSYQLDMLRVPSVEHVRHSTSTIVLPTPLYSKNSTARKARFLTPYNQLVGAVIITQTRLTKTCPLKQDAIGTYAASKEAALGIVCRGSELDPSFYGSDPAFIPTSSLYRGDIRPEQFYTSSERRNDSGRVPYGFFPHFYDQTSHMNKSSKYVVKREALSFKVFFTERLSAAAAQRMLTFMIDGGFVDTQTQEISVQFATLNSRLNMFSLVTLTFSFLVLLICILRSCRSMLLTLKFF